VEAASGRERDRVHHGEQREQCHARELSQRQRASRLLPHPRTRTGSDKRLAIARSMAAVRRRRRYYESVGGEAGIHAPSSWQRTIDGRGVFFLAGRGRSPRSSRICARPSGLGGNWQIGVSAQLFWPKFSHLRGRVGFTPPSGLPPIIGGILFFAPVYLVLLSFALIYFVTPFLSHITLVFYLLPLLNYSDFFSFIFRIRLQIDDCSTPMTLSTHSLHISTAGEVVS
jgi:hypothetical protein